MFESFHIDQAFVWLSERFAGQLYLGRKRGKVGLIHVLLIDAIDKLSSVFP